MLRVTRETDYGILLLTCFSRFFDQSILSTRQVSNETGVPYRMTCKILNLLVRQGLLDSQRGVQGGYRLARAPQDINLRDVISALEGPIALTECSQEVCDCELEENCMVRPHWRIINEAFQRSLEGITLLNMTQPSPSTLTSLYQLKEVKN